MRTFVRVRQILATNRDLARKVDHLDRKVSACSIPSNSS
jgi:hypothetical protein